MAGAPTPRWRPWPSVIDPAPRAGGAGREDPAAHPPGLWESQDVVDGHASWRRSRPPPGVPGRVHVPLQPSAHPDGGLPDVAGPRLGGSWADDLRDVVRFGVNPIGRRRVITARSTTGSKGVAARRRPSWPC